MTAVLAFAKPASPQGTLSILHRHPGRARLRPTASSSVNNHVQGFGVWRVKLVVLFLGQLDPLRADAACRTLDNDVERPSDRRRQFVVVLLGESHEWQRTASWLSLWPLRAFWSFRAFWTLRALFAGRPLHTRCARRSCRPLRPLRSLLALWALFALRTLCPILAGWTLLSRIALVALRTGRTSWARRTLRPRRAGFTAAPAATTSPATGARRTTKIRPVAPFPRLLFETKLAAVPLVFRHRSDRSTRTAGTGWA